MNELRGKAGHLAAATAAMWPAKAATNWVRLVRSSWVETFCILESVGSHEIGGEIDEAIHVLAAGDGAAFALVELARRGLFVTGGTATGPEALDGGFCLGFVVGEIQWHGNCERVR